MRRLVKCCKRTIRDLGKFADKYEVVTNDEIVRPSWHSSSSPVSLGYLAYRWLQLFLHIAFELFSVFDVGRKYSPNFVVSSSIKRTAKYYMKWLLYLTHWGLIINTVQAVFGVWLVHRAYDLQNRSHSNTERSIAAPTECDVLTKMYCYIWSIALHLSVYITSGYWLLVYDSNSCGLDIVTLTEHGFGSALLILDFSLARVPYKMFSGICTILLSAFYLLITYIHHLLHALDRFQDKPFIYEKGDWSHPGAVIIYYIFSVFVMISFHFTLWGLQLLKRRIINGTFFPNSNENIQSTS